MLASSYPAVIVLALYVVAMLAHALAPMVRAYQERALIRANPPRLSRAGWVATKAHVAQRKVRVAWRTYQGVR